MFRKPQAIWYISWECIYYVVMFNFYEILHRIYLFLSDYVTWINRVWSWKPFGPLHSSRFNRFTKIY